MRKINIALRYGLFAMVATAANILCQEAVFSVYMGYYRVFVSLFVGTVIGLLVKYVLDKKYIFYFQAKNHRHDAHVFILYTLMSVLTTIIFWGFELGFDYWFGSKVMRYTGAVIGLAIGYYLKYRLDKRFVFK
jgi:putative flippase GtrA